MYEYKFVKIEMKGTFKLEPEEDYQSIANQYGRDGWRLIQVLTPPTVGYGTVGYYELVFERRIKDE